MSTTYKNEELVGRAIKGKRDKICWLQVGIVRDPTNPAARESMASPTMFGARAKGI